MNWMGFQTKPIRVGAELGIVQLFWLAKRWNSFGLTLKGMENMIHFPFIKIYQRNDARLDNWRQHGALRKSEPKTLILDRQIWAIAHRAGIENKIHKYNSVECCGDVGRTNLNIIHTWATPLASIRIGGGDAYSVDTIANKFNNYYLFTSLLKNATRYLRSSALFGESESAWFVVPETPLETCASTWPVEMRRSEMAI